MAKAVWNGVVLAESDETRIIEGNHYFPPDAINWDHFAESKTTTVCPWKGKASYYSIEVDGEVNRDAAWTYPNPKAAAREISDYVAFWRGVRIL